MTTFPEWKCFCFFQHASQHAVKLFNLSMRPAKLHSGWARATKTDRLGSSHTEGLKNGICGLSSLVLGFHGWVQGNGSRAVLLPLTRHQCSIHCESSRVAHGTSKRRRAPQTTRDVPERRTMKWVWMKLNRTFQYFSRETKSCMIWRIFDCTVYLINTLASAFHWSWPNACIQTSRTATSNLPMKLHLRNG